MQYECSLHVSYYVNESQGHVLSNVNFDLNI